MGSSDQSRPSAGELADTLTTHGYLELFLRGDDTALQAIWSGQDAPRRLRRLALDVKAAALPRFLAAEVLFACDPSFPPPSDRGRLALLYALALRNGLTGMANPWGLPGQLDGPVAQHAVALGRPAVPALAPLLNDEGTLRYSGSEDATVGNSYKYRVKDVAASLVAALIGIPHPVHLDPRERDAQIDALRQRL